MSSTIASDFDGLQVTIGNLASRMLVVVDGHGCAINQIPVTVTSRSYSTLKVGSHCRSMLIVQPPVLCMKMMISCCATKRGDSFDDDGWGGRSSPMATRIDFTAVDDATDHHSDTAGEEREEDETTSLTSADAMHNAKVAETLEIRCHSGITVGHIHDAVQKLRETHRKCPHASLHEHDKDGTVRPEITFTAILELKKDEPYIFEKDRAYVRDRLSSLRCDMDSLGVMEIYIDCKKRAHENDWPIPSFDEFRVKYGVEERLEGNRGWSGACGGWSQLHVLDQAWEQQRWY